ncbi:MAG: hypothetical protein IJ060_02830 [Oscillospiraceae bacterium]|nr:hypothetical protein [Oscillospiraceae bacterium]
MKQKLLICAASLLLTGCGAAAEGSSEAMNETTGTQNQTTASETTTVTETTAAPEPAVPYLEQCRAKMTEVPPEEILVKRENAVYPEFQKYSYYSSVCGREKTVNVLLPADYRPDVRYPVLYILHGSADNEDWMARDEVYLSTMLNNLIADGEAKEMIVVSPYIYCSLDGSACTALNREAFLNFDRFIEETETDLKPFIEQQFSVAEGPENTAVTGFSIGGRESLGIGFLYPEQFGYIGSICTASGVVKGTGNTYLLEPEQFCLRGEPPYLLLLSASEIDRAVGDIPFGYEQMLSENGTEHLWHLMTTTGHEVGSVISHMYNFYRMVFQAM